jgi:hypothetical protein
MDAPFYLPRVLGSGRRNNRKTSIRRDKVLLVAYPFLGWVQEHPNGTPPHMYCSRYRGQSQTLLAGMGQMDWVPDMLCFPSSFTSLNAERLLPTQR